MLGEMSMPRVCVTKGSNTYTEQISAELVGILEANIEEKKAYTCHQTGSTRIVE